MDNINVTLDSNNFTYDSKYITFNDNNDYDLSRYHTHKKCRYCKITHDWNNTLDVPVSFFPKIYEWFSSNIFTRKQK